jgi:tRNA (cmo5U34)-methyltransferase
MNFPKDSISASPIGEVGAFEYDGKTASVFTDMIQRSVPGYNVIIFAIGLLIGCFAREHSVCCFASPASSR